MQLFSKRFKTSKQSFKRDFDSYVFSGVTPSSEVQDLVSSIIEEIQLKGDEALIHYTNLFDKRDVKAIDECIFDSSFLDNSYKTVNKEELVALELSARRIEEFHRKTLLNYKNNHKNDFLYRVFNPLERAGVYVPGGKASYPSSVLMGCVPAQVAEVGEVCVTMPTPSGKYSHLTLAAAKIAKIDKVYTFGGAQAIAALSLGTESISRVDKIIGPGNKFVTEAKRQLYGRVGIDGIQGPSEIVVIANEDSKIEVVAWDLISQAEHDEFARPILISDSKDFIDNIEKNLLGFLKETERKEIILESFRNHGCAIEVRDISEAIDISNQIAPEHLHLSIKEVEKFIPKVLNAGLILLGQESSIALSDYILGPSHILPTGGSARFASSLCVEDFIKFSNIVDLRKMKKHEYENLIDNTIILANSEGLPAHAISARVRKKP
tara:strand:+ start:21917 stop:23224 length:1308 start_codon:yes stop_codon:yes gene_type:complete